jgi:hypothetical protein
MFCGNLPQGKQTTPTGAKKVGSIYTLPFIETFRKRWPTSGKQLKLQYPMVSARP